MSSVHFTPSALIVGSLLAVVSLPKLLACGDSETRLGSEGESCTKTDECATPLVCRALVCTDPGAAGTTASSGSAGTGSTATTSATTSSTASGAGGAGSSSSSSSSSAASTSSGMVSSSPCDDCLDVTCATEEAACDAGCVGIEACIQMVCANLSMIGSPEEGQCQVYCQNQFPGAKPKHLAVANCADGASCGACAGFPIDHDNCVTYMTANGCAAAWSACTADVDCQAYRDCVFVCDDLASCLACDDTPAGASGRALLEAYHQCIASECVAEAWIP